MKAIKKNNFTPNSSSRVCDVHFIDQDYQMSSSDTNQCRRSKNKNKLILKKKSLLLTAVPSIFPQLPEDIPTITFLENQTFLSEEYRKENDDIINNLNDLKLKFDMYDT